MHDPSSQQRLPATCWHNKKYKGSILPKWS